MFLSQTNEKTYQSAAANQKLEKKGHDERHQKGRRSIDDEDFDIIESQGDKDLIAFYNDTPTTSQEHVGMKDKLF